LERKFEDVLKADELSWVVLLTFGIIQPYIAIASMLFYFLFLAASVCLFPALIGVWLVKTHLRWYAAHPSAQQ
jgi:hypothetical protein